MIPSITLSILAIRIVYIMNKSENATLQLSIFCGKVLDKKYLLKPDNVSQTSSKRFVETHQFVSFDVSVICSY